MRNKRSLSKEKKQEIINWYVANDRMTKIAKDFGICRQTVTRSTKKNQQKVNECFTQKKKIEEQGDINFFNKIVKVRDLALNRFIEKLERDSVSAKSLVTAIGVFTDKLESRQIEEQPTTVILKFPGNDENMDSERVE